MLQHVPIHVIILYAFYGSEDVDIFFEIKFKLWKMLTLIAGIELVL
jgi:hypothetical protein